MKNILRIALAGATDLVGLYVVHVGFRLLIWAYKLEDGQPEKDIIGRYVLDLSKALERRHAAMLLAYRGTTD